MSYEKISCRIAIQMCVGHFPDGRERHRTFSLRHVRPDVPFETVLELARALAPILAYPITKVTKVTKVVLFSEEDAIAIPAPRVNAGPDPSEPGTPEEGRIIPPIFSVTNHPATHWATANGAARLPSYALSFASGQKSFMPERSPPARTRAEYIIAA